jgi:hypothetical protein
MLVPLRLFGHDTVFLLERYSVIWKLFVWLAVCQLPYKDCGWGHEFFFFWKYCLVDLDLCLLGFIWKSHINKFCSFFLWITFEGVHLRESHVKVTAKVELSPWLVLIQSPALPACYTSKVWCLLFSQIKACKARALWCELDVLLVCLCLELTSNLVVNASLLFFNLNL